jgi:hypothetical protein
VASERFSGHDPARGDTAGVPWHGRTLSPREFEHDDGLADPRLLAALARPEQEAELVDAVARARLVVPILAVPGSAAASDMAAVTLTSAQGLRALPAFTSAEALTTWNDQARPVPVSAQRAALAATQEGCAMVVLDPGTPRSASLRASMVWALALGREWRPSHADDHVRQAVAMACREEEAVTSWRTMPGEGGALLIEIALPPGLSETDLSSIARRVGARVAAQDDIRRRLDAVGFRFTTAS